MSLRDDLLDLIAKYARYPHATICRHSVGCDIAELLEKHYGDDVEMLVSGLVNGQPGDGKTLEAIEGLRMKEVDRT